jgi:predicted permease
LSLLLNLFADNLLPVFIAAGAGYLLAHAAPVDTRAFARIIFNIFSPCLVFNLLTQNELGNGAMLRMAGFALSTLLLSALLGWALARLFRLDKTTTVAVVLAALLPNAGNFGLSANQFAFGGEAVAYASLFFIISGMTAYTVGVYVASLGKSSPRQALLGLFRVPAIYAVLLAFAFIFFGWELPVPVARAAALLGDAAIPCMVVLLGMLLRHARWSGKVTALALANTVRLLASPAIGIVLAGVFGLTGAARQAGIFESAMPAAVMITVLSGEFEIESELITAIVFTSTLLSPLTLTPLLAYLQ